MTELDGAVDDSSAALGALPFILTDHAAAVLLVDLARGEVLYANELARQLAPQVELPVTVAGWSSAAGLQGDDGYDLGASAGPLERVAAGEPIRGELVTAARSSQASAAREDLWVVGMPLQDAPAALGGTALVIFLPVRNGPVAAQLQEVGDLRHRAVVASDLSFTISDPHAEDDPLVWVNPAFELATGYLAEEVIGRNCRFLQGPATDPQVVDRLRDGLRRGGTLSETLLNYRKDGTPFWNQLVISPMYDATGRLTHHVAIQTDVTARVVAEHERERALGAERRTNHRLRLLSSVSGALARLLDSGELLSSIPGLVVPELADWGLVVGRDARGRPDQVHLAHTDAARVAAVHAAASTREGWLNGSPVLQGVLSGEVTSLQVYPLTRQALAAVVDDPAIVDALVALGTGTAVSVPLSARGGVVGLLMLVRVGEPAAGRPAFGEEDLASIADLGLRAGLALDNALLYEREHAAALTLQRSLLPELPQLSGFDVAATYHPSSAAAEVGGDWYDVLDLPGPGVGVAVGDVTGHDLRAAAAMGQLRSVLRSYAWQGLPPSEVIARLDTLVQGLGMADVATCVYAVVDDGEAGASPREVAGGA